MTTTTPTTSAPSRGSAPEPGRPDQGWRAELARRLDSPLATYYILVSATGLLLALGLVMVLSSSSVEAVASQRSPYADFARQALFAVIGLPLMLTAIRLSVRSWQRIAWPLLLVAVFGLLLVFSPLGRGSGGNRNWVYLAGFTLQPSEAAKLALAVWGATVLARKRALLGSSLHALVPVAIPGALVILGLVLGGRDLGTALVLILILVALLWVAGAPLRLFVLGGAVLSAGVLALVTTSANRMGRIQTWIGGSCDYQGTCWQPTHGKWALASGGWWGVGLGGSTEKWSWLPEAHNDFIFAIIGEELGLAGTLTVLLLFAALAVGMFRVVRRSSDPFVKVATGAVMVWVLGQALINIGTVTGVLPVIGIPLPLISAGGSALILTMVALGMVIGFARSEPDAALALAARGRVVRRSLAVVPGRSSRPRRRGLGRR